MQTDQIINSLLTKNAPCPVQEFLNEFGIDQARLNDLIGKGLIQSASFKSKNGRKIDFVWAEDWNKACFGSSKQIIETKAKLSLPTMRKSIGVGLRPSTQLTPTKQKISTPNYPIVVCPHLVQFFKIPEIFLPPTSEERKDQFISLPPFKFPLFASFSLDGIIQQQPDTPIITNQSNNEQHATPSSQRQLYSLSSPKTQISPSSVRQLGGRIIPKNMSAITPRPLTHNINSSISNTPQNTNKTTQLLYNRFSIMLNKAKAIIQKEEDNEEQQKKKEIDSTSKSQEQKQQKRIQDLQSLTSKWKGVCIDMLQELFPKAEEMHKQQEAFGGNNKYGSSEYNNNDDNWEDNNKVNSESVSFSFLSNNGEIDLSDQFGHRATKRARDDLEVDNDEDYDTNNDDTNNNGKKRRRLNEDENEESIENENKSWDMNENKENDDSQEEEHKHSSSSSAYTMGKFLDQLHIAHDIVGYNADLDEFQ
ncbi:MAG: hypothetical protein EZS28_002218 [Streblomastix strix]|uniref:Uncharacterized protein n=1 Tax=Streblomastix strix TaxID=222440 RepID=A0A5J4X635_9EUKA|nr:MAG: hypothetical protein EZS28_002218 [Streblomastix strix]